MSRIVILAALFAVSFSVTVGSFAASAHAEVEDYSFDIEQVLSVGR